MERKRKHDQTRERLLDEGEALFALKGYDAVSVREITKAANCNLAAVNYHFGSKKNLYLEVFRSRWMRRAGMIRDLVGKSLSEQDKVSPRSVVQAVALAFLEGPMTHDERVRHFQLMLRELARPTEALELVADNVMKPFFSELAGKLRPVMPDKIDKEQTILNLLSVFAMVLYFNFAQEAVTRITGRKYDSAFKAKIVEHIIDFSLGGLGRRKKEDV